MVTLSLVITSCGGMSRTTVLKLTLVILSMMGMRMMSPGPLGVPRTLPSLNITPLSYSFKIFIALARKKTINTIIKSAGIPN